MSLHRDQLKVDRVSIEWRMLRQLSRRVFTGIGVSKGVSTGKCVLLESEDKRSGKEREDSATRKIPASEDEADRFASAVEHVKQELTSMKVKVAGEAGKDAGEIFEAQILMLEDPLLMSEVINKIRDDQLTAEEAVSQTVELLTERFSTLSSTYMRERGEDIRDLGSRLLDILRGRHKRIATLVESVRREGARVVLASTNLAAATIAHFGRSLLAAVVAETGSATSHLAIVARSLRIPTVLGVKDIIRELKHGDQILVDGDKGEVILNPPEAEIEKRTTRTEKPSIGTTLSTESTATIDGHRVQIFANVANLEGVREAVSSGAEGVGLFRTEFLYFDRQALPSEDELFNILKQSVSIMQGKTVIVRTLDIGGDKKPPYIDFPEEKNPALGLRGIRYNLKDPSLLETQIAAILRASTEGDLWIMFPMISTVSEVRDAKAIVEKVKLRLGEAGMTFNKNTKIGVMIETPSAALMSGKLAAEVDFFSIGTNDLAQYTLAADRENENVAAVADPLEPAVLKLIHQTIESAHANERHVGMCGEMAADVDATPLLLGMGLDEFSVDPSNVEVIKKTIRNLNYTETTEAGTDALKLESAKDVREYSRKRFSRYYKGNLEGHKFIRT
jgi:phosphotransferase system enzyme I (PtsI)